MNMKTWREFILEKRSYSDTGVNQDIIKLATYIISEMQLKNKKKEVFHIDDLVKKFPFLESWEYRMIVVSVNPKYINKVFYLRLTNSIGIYLKTFSRGSLNHELMHILQSTTDKGVLLIDYENRSVLTQIKNFFRKNSNRINLLDNLLYFSDEREMGSYIQAFKKYEKKKKVEILSYILLLRYFDLKNLITNTNTMRQFVSVWYQYYGSSIPFFDRLRLQRRITNNTLEINKEEVETFIKTINEKLNLVGKTYLAKLGNQYSDSEEDTEKLAKLLNLAKINISRNSLDDIVNLIGAKKLRSTQNRDYEINNNT